MTSPKSPSYSVLGKVRFEPGVLLPMAPGMSCSCLQSTPHPTCLPWASTPQLLQTWGSAQAPSVTLPVLARPQGSH